MGAFDKLIGDAVGGFVNHLIIKPAGDKISGSFNSGEDGNKDIRFNEAVAFLKTTTANAGVPKGEVDKMLAGFLAQEQGLPDNETWYAKFTPTNNNNGTIILRNYDESKITGDGQTIPTNAETSIVHLSGADLMKLHGKYHDYLAQNITPEMHQQVQREYCESKQLSTGYCADVMKDKGLPSPANTPSSTGPNTGYKR